jgi:xylulokinase
MGIDIGTTAVKVAVVSGEGRIVCEASREHNLLSPYPGWAEEDAEKWWDNTALALRQLSEAYPDVIKNIDIIGCSGMVPAIVMLDEAGVPLRYSIQQNDARTVAEIEELKCALDQNELFRQTGSKTNQQNLLPRLLWVRRNEPEVWRRCATVMGSYDFIALRLTGTRSLELNWAAESAVFNIYTRRWITEQLRDYGVDPAVLPPVNEPMAVIGRVLPEIAAQTGLKAGVPVIAGSADHVASALSAGIVDRGDLLIKFGGAGDILYCTDDIAPSDKLFFDYHDVPGKYLLSGCMAASGSLVKWYLDEWVGDHTGETLKKMDKAAELVPAASDGLVILPYFLGEKTPLFDPSARGVICGLTLSHKKEHIFRAILECVVYGFRHHLEVYESLGYRPDRIVATNGGAKSSFWCQIAADVLGREVRSYPSHAGSSLGVAFVAGMRAGIFLQWRDIDKFLTDYRTYLPIGQNVAIYNKAYAVYRDLYRQLLPSFAHINALYK